MVYVFYNYILICSLFSSALPFGYPIINHGLAKRNPLYVGDLTEGISRIIRLNSDLFDGKTFDLFGYTKRWTTKQLAIVLDQIL